jgi:hypothetical protein
MTKTLPTLSQASCDVFSKYLSRYQYALDDPSKSPRKAEIAHAILNKGKPGACTFCRDEGYKIVLRPMHKWTFEKGIRERAKLYYVSHGETALLYLDIDLHNAWQTEAHGQEAMRLIEALLGQWFGKSVIFWVKSKRGFNGYLKVNGQRMPPKAANAIFTRLQHALQLFLAYRKNLADFEIKGDFGFMENCEYQWGKYGKLPIHSPDWNFLRLQEFSEKPTVMLARLRLLCDQIEKIVPKDVLDRHQVHKKSLGDAPITNKGYFLVTKAMKVALEAKYGELWREEFGEQYGAEDVWLSLKYHRPGQLPMTVKEWLESQTASAPQAQAEGHEPDTVPLVKLVASVGSSPRATPSKVNLDFFDLVDEPDSFKRQKEALVRFSRYLKRVPSLEQALCLFQSNRLFSGAWGDNENKRKTRTQSILTFISQTFDASKCAKGSVNVGKYDEWAKKKFPNGFTGGRKRYLNQEGKVVRGCRRSHVGPTFISVFMSIAEFALLIDKNKDETFPHKRAEQVWNALYLRGLISVKFCARKWAVCREEMVRCGVIVITDRNYGPERAMKWEEGRFFPGLGLWKGEKQVSLMGPSKLEKKNNRETRHNTLLYTQPANMRRHGGEGHARPPPLN